MKSKIGQYAIMIAALVMVLFSVNPVWAGTLSSPRGLALDVNGNLYIVNFGSDSVVVYNPNYVKVRSITKGMNLPVSVAFDSHRNIYIANSGNNSITQYSSAGVQNTNFLITNGINDPWAISIDPLDDLWVTNVGAQDLVAYTLVDSAQQNNPIFTLPLGEAAFGITTHGGDLEVGTTAFMGFGYTAELLQGKGFAGIGGLEEALALATDSAGNIYESNAAGLLTGPQGTILTEPFGIEGLAVDKTRGRIYVSNQNGNAVLVYNLQGVLLHAIE